MDSRIDEVEKQLSDCYKNRKRVTAVLGSSFTARVMADVRLTKMKKNMKQETIAWRTGWVTFAAAALVMIYFGMTFEQTSISEDLLTTVYSDDSVSLFETSF